MTRPQAGVDRVRHWSPTRWLIWSHPTRVWVWLVVVELVAVALIVVTTVCYADYLAYREAWILAVTLALAGLIHAELSIRAERVRRRLAETRYVDLSSVWTLAAALLLPPPIAVAVVVVIYAHLYRRVYRPAGTPPHRQIYSNTTVVLAVCSVAALQAILAPDRGASGWAPVADFSVVGLAVSLISYMLINTLLVVTVIRLSVPGSSFWKIFAGGEILLELSTLCLAVLGSIAMSVGRIELAVPLVALLLLLPLMLLEYTTVIGELQRRVDVDSKTGLLNPRVWEAKVDGLIDLARRRRGALAILVLDLDHFKRVNDVHGHLVGDAVLHTVAAVLQREVRDHDVVGRFGGEEFVIALTRLRDDDPATSPLDAAAAIAERIRASIEAEPVETYETHPGAISPQTVSIGAVVVSSSYTGTVAELVSVADRALYEAKNAGRNRCRVQTLAGSTGPAVP